MKMTMREFENEYQMIPDLIRCSVGQPGYGVPPVVLDRIKKELEKSLFPYPAHGGDPELIQKIAVRHKIPVEDIAISHGASEALWATFQAIFDEPGECLVFTPSYPAFFSLCKMMNSEAIELVGDFPDYRINIEKMEALITEKTKAVILISCGNPTGQPLNPDDLAKVEKLCLKYQLTLIYDRSYVAFEPKPLELSRECRYVEIHSFSKSYGMTEFRVGYCFGTAKLMKKIKANLSLCTVGVATSIQKAASLALDLSTDTVKENITNNSCKMIELLNQAHLPCGQQPGFYCYFSIQSLKMDAQTFCDRCAKEAGVLLMCGDFFGAHQEYNIRACCAIERFDEAVIRLQAFLQQLK